MIPLAVLVAAAAFWTPYNGGSPICSEGVQVIPVAPTVPRPADVDQDATAFTFLSSGCRLWMSHELYDGPDDELKCVFVTHELGHSAMGLPDSEDRRNVMYGPAPAEPATCRVFRRSPFRDQISKHRRTTKRHVRKA